jgi:hypothetical protein
MHAQICQFPSKTLYASKLKSHDSISSHLLRDLPNTTPFVETKDEETIKEILGTPVVFFDTAGCEYYERLEGDGDEGSRCNENEATVVKEWTEKLVRRSSIAHWILPHIDTHMPGRSRATSLPNSYNHPVSRVAVDLWRLSPTLFADIKLRLRSLLLCCVPNMAPSSRLELSMVCKVVRRMQ